MGCRAGEYVRKTKRGRDVVGRRRNEALARMADEGLVPLVSAVYPLTTIGVRNCCRDLLERRVVGRACVVSEEVVASASSRL
jgi:hypothetical protein